MFSKKKPVSDEYLKELGLRKHKEEVAKGVKNPITPNAYFNRRNTIKKYWDYKIALKAIADLEKFEVPKVGGWFKFYMPIAKGASKKKRAEMCFELHTQMPDSDNMIKAFFDSLLSKDALISDYRSTKYWVDGRGFIEVTVGELPIAKGYTKMIHRDDKIK